MRWTVSLAAALSLCLVVLTGCPSISTLTTAKPIGDGKNEIAASPGVIGFTAAALGNSTDSKGNTTTTTTTTGTVYAPTLDLMYRHGFGDWFDLGISITGFGNVGVDGKFNLLNTGFLAVSLDPGVSGVFVGSGDVAGGYVELSLPVLVDFQLANWLTLTVWPKYIGIYAFGTSSGSTVDSFNHFLGGGGGLEFKFGEVFRLMPHGGAVAWANSPDGVEGNVWFEGGLAAKFVF